MGAPKEGDKPTPTFTVSGDTADKLDPAIRKRLLEQYPKHDYLP